MILSYFPWLGADHGPQTAQAKQQDAVQSWLSRTYYGAVLLVGELPTLVHGGGNTAEVHG